MRFLPTMLAAGAIALATGCNAIFGLDEVSQKAPPGGGGDGGGGNGGSPCADLDVPGDLIMNGSFEQDGGIWEVASGNTTLEYVPDGGCDFTCGARFARITRAGEAGVSKTIILAQNIQKAIELGGRVTLRARYRYGGSSAPYFSLIGNGWTFGGLLKGGPAGGHFAVDDVVVTLDDPRRAADHIALYYNQNSDAEVATSDLDCIAVTYEPPPGEQLLSNGFFEVGGPSGWQAEAMDVLLEAAPSQGLCLPGAGRVTIPAGLSGDVLGAGATGSWPKDTVFRFGGAAGPPSNSPALPPAAFTLRLDYESDGDMGTPDFEEQKVPGLTSGEPWVAGMGEIKAARPVVSASIHLAVDTTGVSPPEATVVLADCFSLRALPP